MYDKVFKAFAENGMHNDTDAILSCNSNVGAHFVDTQINHIYTRFTAYSVTGYL